ncbi:MAG: hypothetical protein ACRC0Y_03230 [Fusobacteriaceae bacterium]
MVLTEEKLRSIYKKDDKTKEIFLEKGTILTPSAKQYLIDKNIKILEKITKNMKEEKEVKESKYQELKPNYEGMFGEFYIEKPEHMTQIHGNVLVKKDDKRIIFRGAIDSFQSSWLVLIKDLKDIKNSELHKDLENLEKFIKKILISEVVGEAMIDIKILEKTLDEIRDISHNPQKHFNRGHLFEISSKDNYIVIKLNEMRALSRKLEIKGIQAFIKENGVIERSDILLALNRLSSAIYIMMLRGMGEEYGNR